MSVFEGLAAIFTGVFGEAELFVLRRPGVADVSFTGIWTERYVASDGGEFSEVDSNSAAVDAQSAVLGTIEQDDCAEIERTKTGDKYRIRSVQPEEKTGMTTIILQRARKE